MAEPSKKTVILSKASDWDKWLYLVQSRAKTTRIWDLVDPSKATKPTQLSEPQFPELAEPREGQAITPEAYEAYRSQSVRYRDLFTRFKRQEKALSDLTTYIQSSISIDNLSFIISTEPHPWNILRALQKRLTPTDQARLIELELQYRQLYKPPKLQGIEQWLKQWETFYTEATKHKLWEVEGQKPIRDFLFTLQPIEPAFVAACQA